jgi:hypothetical protein
LSDVKQQGVDVSLVVFWAMVSVLVIGVGAFVVPSIFGHHNNPANSLVSPATETMQSALPKPSAQGTMEKPEPVAVSPEVSHESSSGSDSDTSGEGAGVDVGSSGTKAGK